MIRKIGSLGNKTVSRHAACYHGAIIPGSRASFLKEQSARMNFFRRMKTRYVLRRHALRHDHWQAATGKLWMLDGLSAVEKARLRKLSTLFLHQKNFVGIGVPVTQEMRILIAAQACLPILNLDSDLLSEWTDIVIYPASFRVTREEMDRDGVVHRHEHMLSGESWLKGPVVLSWDDIKQDLHTPQNGHNVIIHEIAHKLDMLDGSSNGLPPLHESRSIPGWATVFSTAYQQLQKKMEQGQYTGIHPYAATSPAEFFAVSSEYFFCAPAVLHAFSAEVYENLQLFYRQQPLIRFHAHG